MLVQCRKKLSEKSFTGQTDGFSQSSQKQDSPRHENDGEEERDEAELCVYFDEAEIE